MRPPLFALLAAALALALALAQEHLELYERLGVQNDANARAIKRAFRKLSLKWHPDKNKNSQEAQDRFKSISEAYEILSDDEKRRTYDLGGMEGLERKDKQAQGGGSPFDAFFGGGGGGGGGQKGPNAEVTIPVTLEDLYNGAQRSARISRNVICVKCRGTGAKGGSMKKCKACKGQGVRLVNQQMGPGFTVQMQQQCPRCGGKGSIIKHKCPACGGAKVMNEEKLLTADIERGMPSNHHIVFERESEQQPGITPGDVVFKLKAEKHPRFTRRGNDLHHTMHISLKDALLGFRKTIQHLDSDGREVVVERKKGSVTKPFEVMKLTGEGMPHYEFPSERGALHVKFIVDFPRRPLTDAQRAEVLKWLA